MFVAGSKMCVWTMPLSCWSLFPPARNIRPSRRCARPLQKTLKPVSTLTGVCDARRGIPHGRARVVLHGVRLGRVVADRVVREHLAVGQQRDVDADDRPVDDGAPLPTSCGPPDARAPLPATARRDGARVGVERPLLLGVCVTASSAAWPAAVLRRRERPHPGHRVQSRRQIDEHDAQSRQPFPFRRFVLTVSRRTISSSPQGRGSAAKTRLA